MADRAIRESWPVLAEAIAVREYEAALRIDRDYSGDLHVKKLQKAAELMGVEVRILDWEKDKTEIENIANNLLAD